MEPIIISKGYKTAVVSLHRSPNHDDRPRYVVVGRNGGRTRLFITLAAAVAYAERYVS